MPLQLALVFECRNGVILWGEEMLPISCVSACPILPCSCTRTILGNVPLWIVAMLTDLITIPFFFFFFLLKAEMRIGIETVLFVFTPWFVAAGGGLVNALNASRGHLGNSST